jgi:hypothetical protein
VKKIKVECEVTYSVTFECEVEVPDDIFTGEDDSREPTHIEMAEIKDQVEEAALEHRDDLWVEDVDWYVVD